MIEFSINEYYSIITMYAFDIKDKICSKDTITKNIMVIRVFIICNQFINNGIFMFYSEANFINNIDFSDIYKKG